MAGLLRIVILIGISMLGVEGETSPLTQRQQWFMQAEQMLARGERKQFHAWLGRLGDYPLVPYLQYRFYLKYPGEIDGVSQFLDQYADTRYARPVRARLLEHLADQAKWHDYIWFYQDIGSTELQCHYAWALYRQGMTEPAWREVRRLWLVGRSQPKVCDRVFKVWRNAGRLTRDLVWQRFELALRNNKTRLAEYLSKMLSPRERKRAHFWIQVHRAPEKALCNPWPAYFKHDADIFTHGILQLARKDLDIALILWQERLSGFTLTPDQEAQVDRYFGLRLAWHHDPRAWKWLSAVPESVRDDDLRGWRVRVALREEDWSRVTQALEDIPVLDRRETQWQYWQARAGAKIHGQDAARPVFTEVAESTDFYGFLAADRLQGNYRIPHRPVAVPEQVIGELEETLAVRAIREFIQLDRYWEARREWWHLLKRSGREQLLAAAILAQRMDWPQMAIFAVARAEHWDDLDIRFPLRFLDEVRRYSRLKDVDPAYILGIIRRESAFDEHARSPVGARGLMQLMPFTARKVARQLRERLRTVKALEDSTTNVRYGTAYFSSLLQRFNGHFVLATAAYNAGPHRVSRWLPHLRLPADIWIETIPFRETRRYVRAVLAYAMIYQKRLGQPSRRISEYATPVPGKGRPQLKAKGQVCVRSS